MEPADLADALAAAGHAAHRAVRGRGLDGAGLNGAGPNGAGPNGAARDQALLTGAVQLLEAAGGQSVGNSVRRLLEEGAALDLAALRAVPGPREALLRAAAALFDAAERASLVRLDAAGLRAAEPGTARADRVAFLASSLAKDRDAVQSVLAALRQQEPGGRTFGTSERPAPG